MMKMQECVEVLKRCTPDELTNEWLVDRSQMMICSLFLNDRVSVDKREIEGKTDGYVKKLISGRVIGAYVDAVRRMDPDYFTNPDHSGIEALQDNLIIEPTKRT